MRMLEVHRDHLAGDEALGGTLPAAQVSELRLDRWPPEVAVDGGKIGFVHGTRRRDLELFGRLHGIPIVERADVWSYLAEEFLDTERDADEQERALHLLELNGIPREEAAAIRRFIRLPMLALTTLTWEWVHYGLWDVLQARPVRLLPAGWGRDAGFLPRDGSAAELRRWAEAIANRAPVQRSLPRVEEPDDAEVARRLRHRFLARRSPPVEALQEELLLAWSRPERRYHGPRHLLAVLDAVQPHAPANAFTLAAWFHDAVYDPMRSDNEAESARWLERGGEGLVAEGAVTAEELRLALTMVRATARPLDPLPAHPDRAALGRFLDADFQIFASLPEDYDRYVVGVRGEFSHVPDGLFRTGRRAFLAQLQAAVDTRGFFFREASPLAESLARENLARELAGTPSGQVGV